MGEKKGACHPPVTRGEEGEGCSWWVIIVGRMSGVWLSECCLLEPCAAVAGDGHLFGVCPFLPLVRVRESPEFPSLLACDKICWPRCLLWHGWLPMLAPRRVGSRWAAAISDSVEAAFGVCARMLIRWLPGWDREDIAVMSDVPGQPNLWTDGWDEDPDGQVGIAGAGAFVIAPPWELDGRAWGHAQGPDLEEDASRIFPRSTAPLQTVHSAEYWGGYPCPANPHAFAPGDRQ